MRDDGRRFGKRRVDDERSLRGRGEVEEDFHVAREAAVRKHFAQDGTTASGAANRRPYAAEAAERRRSEIDGAANRRETAFAGAQLATRVEVFAGNRRVKVRETEERPRDQDLYDRHRQNDDAGRAKTCLETLATRPTVENFTETLTSRGVKRGSF